MSMHHEIRPGLMTHYSGLYGANRSLFNLILGAREYYGIECCVVVPSEGRFTELLEKHAIRYSIFRFERWIQETRFLLRKRIATRIRRAISGPTYLKPIAKWFAENEVSLIHSNSASFGLGHKAATRLGVPHVWHIREHLMGHYNVQIDGGFHRLRRGMTSSAACIAVSQFLKAAINAGPNCEVIYNGVYARPEMQELHSRHQELPRSEELRISIVGLLHENKGHETAVRAIKELEGRGVPSSLVIAGDGPERHRIEKLVDDLSLQKHIKILGYVDHPKEIYAESDVVLMCSKKEAMGRVTAEAMSAGCVVVGLDSGGTPELIRDGETGYLYRQPEELAGILARIAADPSKMQSVGEQAHEDALKRFSIESYVENVKSVWDRVLSH